MTTVLVVLVLIGLLAGVGMCFLRRDPDPSLELDPLLMARAEVTLHRIHAHREEEGRKAEITRRAQLTRRMMHAEMAASRERRRTS